MLTQDVLIYGLISQPSKALRISLFSLSFSINVSSQLLWLSWPAGQVGLVCFCSQKAVLCIWLQLQTKVGVCVNFLRLGTIHRKGSSVISFGFKYHWFPNLRLQVVLKGASSHAKLIAKIYHIGDLDDLLFSQFFQEFRHD